MHLLTGLPGFSVALVVAEVVRGKLRGEERALHRLSRLLAAKARGTEGVGPAHSYGIQGLNLVSWFHLMHHRVLYLSGCPVVSCVPGEA